MGNYTAGSGNGTLCRKGCGRAYDLVRVETTTEYDGKKTIVEVYKCRGCGHEWRLAVYKEH